MQFFLYEIVARLVAIYLCIDSGRRLWYGFGQRKIADWNNGGVADWLIDSSKVVYRRDAAPVRYWILISLQTWIFIVSLVMAVCGWWHPQI